jgi:hypothetical protein
MTVLKDYTSRVIQRADHHGQEVADVIPSLVGYVGTYADPSSISHRRYKGELAATFGGRKVVFSYCHQRRMIVARDGSLKGPEIGTFNNLTSQPALRKFFRSL